MNKSPFTVNNVDKPRCRGLKCAIVFPATRLIGYGREFFIKEIFMTTVRKLLEAKTSPNNYVVAASDTVLQALKVMTDAHVGAALVTENGKIVGIFTERDYLYKGEVEGRVAKTTKVKDVMIGKMFTVTRDTSVEQCMGLMKKHNIRHLPVVEDGQLVGLISIRDVMFAMLESKESEIRGLENYIMGSGFAT